MNLPSVYQLKPRFQDLLRPWVRRLYQAGVTPNQLTVGALVGSVGVGLTLACFPERAVLWGALPVWMLLRMGLNAADGMLAREHALQSPLGGLLNELCDPLSDAALLLPVALLPGASVPLVVAVVLLAFTTELTGTAALVLGASRRFDGPMGKSDRALVFGGLGLALALGVATEPWLQVLLIVVVVLSVLTVLNRGRSALREVGA